MIMHASEDHFPAAACVSVFLMRILATFQVKRSAVMGFVRRMLLTEKKSVCARGEGGG